MSNKKKALSLTNPQKTFIASIKEKIRLAQYEALKEVNTQLIKLYWEIGKDISEKQGENWGESIVSVLSKELQKEFPGISGFSERNLWLMTQFYNEYKNVEILQPLVAEISWTKHITIMSKCKDNQEYFIDLLLFHRELQCLVAIELKIGEFQPEYKGKMEFYLSLLNDMVKMPHENDSIGIIICKEKNRTIVEYSLKTSSMLIGVSTYTTSAKLPKDYKNILPDSKTISQKIDLLFKDNNKQN